MVENSKRVQSSDPSSDALEDINDPIFAHYRYTRSNAAETGDSVDDMVPLFLSNQSDEYRFDGNRPRSMTLSRILAAFFVAAAAAAGFALLPVDAARGIRDIIVDAKESLSAIAPVQAHVAMQAEVKEPVQPVAHHVTVTPPDQPSRDEITTAYQAAIKSLVVAHEPAPAASPVVAPPATPTPRRLDPDELEALLKRARSLLAIGDIAPARLLLARAADAQEADAALMLAGTYDPEVLGTSDTRSVTPDPEQARIWYRKAADLGSQRAQQRLAQMQN